MSRLRRAPARRLGPTTGLSGLLGWIPTSAIDDRAARGLADGSGAGVDASRWRVLLGCKPLLVLAAALALFHLGNGGMLPLYGMAVSAAKQGNPAVVVASTIVVAMALGSVVLWTLLGRIVRPACATRK